MSSALNKDAHSDLTSIDLENIFNIISQTNNTFEGCAKSFSKDLGPDLFRACHLLYNLLIENMLTKSQRLITIFLINESFPNGLNPFTANILDICEKTPDQFEKKFIIDLIVKQSKEIASWNIKNVLNEEEQYVDKFKLEQDFDTAKAAAMEGLPRIPGMKGFELGNILSDFYFEDKNLYFPASSISWEKILSEDMSYQGFSTDFFRPIPSSLPINDNELVWLNPGIVSDVMWDYSMCVENDINLIVKELIQKAYKQTLTNQESSILIDAIEKDPNLINDRELTPELLSSLVEKNSSIASAVLIKLHNSAVFNTFLEKLVNIELTIQSLEVINKLINGMELPQEFLGLFISKSIQQCENTKKDKNLQNRLVRLVCVFIRHLIKNKNFDPSMMFVELQAFCIEFTKIPEASTLFKMLKSLDNDTSKPSAN